MGEAVIPQGIYRDLFQAKWRLWHAKWAKDQAAIDKANEDIDIILETIIERQAEL